MKTIQRPILPYQEQKMLFPLRNKIDYTILVLYAARNLLIDFETQGLEIRSYMKLLVDKMSRLFIYEEKKFFSVSFPFSILLDGSNVVEIATYSGKKIDSYSISAVLSVVENDQFKLNPSPIDFYIESNAVDSVGFLLLEEILQFEPSYIRYDIDNENENARLHPLHHLDVNYSSYGTFKLGLDNLIGENIFEDILNITTDCSFLSHG